MAAVAQRVRLGGEDQGRRQAAELVEGGAQREAVICSWSAALLGEQGQRGGQVAGLVEGDARPSPEEAAAVREARLS